MICNNNFIIKFNNHESSTHKLDIERPELGLVELADGGAFDAGDDVEEAVAAFGDEGVDVEGEAGLEDPEGLEAEGCGEAEIGDEGGERVGRRESRA